MKIWYEVIFRPGTHSEHGFRNSLWLGGTRDAVVLIYYSDDDTARGTDKLQISTSKQAIVQGCPGHNMVHQANSKDDLDYHVVLAEMMKKKRWDAGGTVGLFSGWIELVIILGNEENCKRIWFVLTSLFFSLTYCLLVLRLKSLSLHLKIHISLMFH